MATTLTRNLKLRVDSNLTANAKYNLNQIDLLGTTFLVDTTNTLNLRSIGDILIEPESADIGGSGVGGTLNIGTASHSLTATNIYSSATKLSSPISLLDQGTGGTKYLRIGYNSTLSGAVDTTSDRTLTVDLQGADRNLILAGNLTTVGGSLTLTMTADSSVTMPVTGTLATLAGAETLTNKVIDANSNTISNIANANVAAAAAIAYSKLNLSNSILNADINSAAGIQYSKLALTGSIVNADVSGSAAIAYGKLNLSGSIVNADVSALAQIAYSKLNLSTSIVNADISNSAAISYSKLNLATSIDSGDINFLDANNILNVILPDQTGNSGKALITDGSNATWTAVAGTGTVTSVALTAPAEFSVSGSPVTTTGTLALTKATQSANTVWAGPTSGGAAQPAFRALVVDDLPGSIPYSKLTLTGSIVDADVSGSAAIAYSKLNLASSIVNADVSNSAAIAYSKLNLSGSIVNADVATGAAVGLTKLAATTANRALASDASGYITPSAVTDTELGYLSGVTSAIQTQLGTKESTANKGVANGYAALDSGGKVPISQLPSSIMEYKGAWNASTNSPTLIDGTGDTGDTYRVSVAGTQNLGSGNITFSVGDFVIYNGTIWQRTPASDLSGVALTDLSNLTVSGLATGSLLVGSSGTAVSNLAIGTSGYVLTSNGTTASWLPTSSTVSSFLANWVTGDGSTKVVTHSLGTKDVIVQVYDKTDDSTIDLDSTVRTDNNTVTLTGSEAPGAAGWRVLILAL